MTMVAGASGFSARPIDAQTTNSRPGKQRFILEADLQPVVSDANPGWQFRFARLRQFMGDVSEQGPFRPHLRRYLERLRHTQMGRMRLGPKRVDDQNFYAGDSFHDWVGHCAAIAEV